MKCDCEIGMCTHRKDCRQLADAPAPQCEVQIDDPNMCPNCFGDGYFPKEDLTGDDKCETCNGTGSRIPAVAQAPIDSDKEATFGEDGYNPAYDDGITFAIVQLAELTGSKDWQMRDGSEDHDTDVRDTIMDVLKCAELYDDETGKFAALAQAQTGCGVIAAIDPFTRGAFTGWKDRRGFNKITLDEAEDHFSLCMADMMDAARAASCAQAPTEPVERTYLRGWNEGIECAAELIEQQQERITETSEGSERSLSPRMTGNQMGLAYAAGIRDQVVPSAKVAAQEAKDPIQDTWLFGGPPDLKAMSGSIESDRVIQLHFRRPVTDVDRRWLLEAINAKIAAAGVTVAEATEDDIAAVIVAAQTSNSNICAAALLQKFAITRRASPVPSAERLGTQPGPREGCILCANGNDLPEGEQCAGCGREGHAVGLRAAVVKARGRQEPPSSPVHFSKVPGTQTFNEMRNGIIEECAKIAEPWSGFSDADKMGVQDRAIIKVREEIAAAIRAMAVSSTHLGSGV